MELWTSAHAKTLLPALVVMLILAFVLKVLLGKKDLSVRMIPLQIISGLLVLLEVGKQTLSILRGYDLYHLPFHFCSLFIFALPVMAFYRGKYRQTVGGVVSALCASVFLLMLIYPNLIYSAGNINEFFKDYFSFHTVFFHNLVMMAFVLIAALNLHETGSVKKEIKAMVVFMAGFGIVAAVMSQIFKTNYANMYTCNIPVLEELRVTVAGAIGAVPTQILYVTIVCLLQIGFVVMAYGFYGLARFLLRKAEKKADV